MAPRLAARQDDASLRGLDSPLHPPERRKVRLGGMKDRIQLLPGWDAPIDPDRFLEGDL